MRCRLTLKLPENLFKHAWKAESKAGKRNRMIIVRLGV